MKSSRKLNVHVRLVSDKTGEYSQILGNHSDYSIFDYFQYRLQARMATKKAKPNGQFELKVENVEEYFCDIPISDLPGVGFSTTQKCNNLNLKSCGDLQGVSMQKLQLEFGKKMGETLYQNCRGIDNKPLTYDQVNAS